MPVALFRRASTRLFMALAAAASLLPVAGAKADCGPPDSVYIGSVCTTAADFCPRGYLSLHGQMLDIASNSSLFSLIGCEWGGDCRTTFKLPDMRGRSVVGAGAGPGLTPIERGQWRGAEVHTLTRTEMPTHNHAAIFEASGGTPITGILEAYSARAGSDTPEVGDFISGGGGTPLFGTGGLGAELVELNGLTITGGTAGGGEVTVGNAGMSRPFAIEDPVMALTYCMVEEGLYPPRN